MKQIKYHRETKSLKASSVTQKEYKTTLKKKVSLLEYFGLHIWCSNL